MNKETLRGGTRAGRGYKVFAAMAFVVTVGAGCSGAQPVDILAYKVSQSGDVLQLNIATCARRPSVDVDIQSDVVVVSVVADGRADLDCASRVDVDLPTPIDDRQVIGSDGSPVPRVSGDAQSQPTP